LHLLFCFLYFYLPANKLLSTSLCHSLLLVIFLFIFFQLRIKARQSNNIGQYCNEPEKGLQRIYLCPGKRSSEPAGVVGSKAYKEPTSEHLVYYRLVPKKRS
jgi:hypothetical protein